MQKNKPKISIIIPVYNSEKYIKQCIDSILQNTYTDYEVLLINDGSTDNSLTILEDFRQSDDRIQVINKENQGVAPTRNLGISIAQGEYIVFIDNDDFIDSDYLEIYLQEIEKNKSDIVIGGYKRTNKEKILFSDYPRDSKWGKYIILAPWAKIYRKSFLLKNDIQFLDYPIGEDVYFNLKAFNFTKKISSINYTGYNWFYNGESVSNTSQKGFSPKINIIYFLNKLLEISKNSQENEYFKYYIKRYYIWYLLFSGRQASANEFMNQYHTIKNWIQEKGLESKLNPLSNKLSGENYKNRLIVMIFRFLEKTHLLPIFAKLYCQKR
ncbi:glycosyltransferase family 2 protein [Streptococcaceae bacterium ESL0687]|nr:glycosyltransferase family 2 protein [Streptococcaceae bacterium ESL0687]